MRLRHLKPSALGFAPGVTVLYHVWKKSDEIWRSTIYNYSEHMQTLIDGFEQVELGHSTLEQTRNRL